MASELPARSGRPPVSARGARTRDALVKAAREVFERDGFLDARITDIAATAGVAAGSFYTYFKSKEDVFAASHGRASTRRCSTPGCASSPTATTPSAVIEAANRTYLAAYRRNAKLMALMEQVAQIDEDFRRMRLRRARARSPSATRRRSRSLQQRGLADPEPRSAARRTGAERDGRTHGLLAAYVQRIRQRVDRTRWPAPLTRLWASALGIPPSKPRR